MMDDYQAQSDHCKQLCRPALQEGPLGPLSDAKVCMVSLIYSTLDNCRLEREHNTAALCEATVLTFRT